MKKSVAKYLLIFPDYPSYQPALPSGRCYPCPLPASPACCRQAVRRVCAIKFYRVQRMSF
ncbi:MAG: hypothetical protein M3R36_00040 [Bacteroidota bacterium]|nr:hypothetical protein [Bacteroidota bacterium]